MSRQLKTFRETVAANVRRYRERADWSQEELAQAASLDWTTISRLELAKRGTDLTICKVADALEINVLSLFKAAKFTKRKVGRPKPRS